MTVSAPICNYLLSPKASYPIIALTETWLKPCILDPQISIDNYVVQYYQNLVLLIADWLENGPC